MSGGMDSTLAAYMLNAEGCDIVAVHFNYGQRTQHKELSCFRAIAERLGAVATYEIDLGFFAAIGASALTDKSIAVPTGGIGPGVPVTYVPFRNGIFLSIAAAIAEKEGAGVLGIGVVEEDSSGYPDCREAYIEAMQRAINLGTRDETDITIAMPLVHLKKEQIVAEAFKHGVPLELTGAVTKTRRKPAASATAADCASKASSWPEGATRSPTRNPQFRGG